ncbi:hypothetical protein QEH52_13145 [Coraliomargarita sp. SDUM461003]|uniref:Alginate lyase 2 domain-containing protein n=1 Tax=Thalassobacterium maritimum TaxID=3041265 RepID=A0ABU1AWE2_9BACT|nr:hypothetical protein [Coraliomargarita sp. SDUM461003]MDQ8208463.1 hypothetical protein [Coraliomargarita sp. SDUM461003]
MVKAHICWFCITLSVLFAVDPLQTQASEEHVSISFQTISWGQAVKDVFYASANGEEQIFSPNASFSKTQRYTGPATLQFYRKEKTENGYSKTPVALTTLTTAAKGHYIFVFIKDAQSSGERYRLYPILFDAKMGKPNQVTLVNLSSNKMIGRLDDAKFELNAGKMRMVDVHPNSGGNVLAQFLLETDDGWKPLYSNNWRVYEGKQIFAFIARKDVNSSKINVRLIFMEDTEFQ